MSSRGKLMLLLAKQQLKPKENSNSFVINNGAATPTPGSSGTNWNNDEEQDDEATAQKYIYYDIGHATSFDLGGKNNIEKLGDTERVDFHEDTDTDEPYEDSGSEYSPDNDQTMYRSDQDFVSDENEDNDNQDNQDAIIIAENFEITNPVIHNESIPRAEDLENKNVDVTTRGTKRVKSFPVRQKVSKIRARNPALWKRNKAAISRQKGEEYVNQKGQVVPSKTATLGNLCECRLKCSKNIDQNKRNRILQEYYNLNINAQNSLLFKSIIPKSIARPRKGAKKPKTQSYEYTIVVENRVITVCKTALCSLYQIGRKKLDIIKEKLKSGSSAPSTDLRGRHQNRPHKLKEEIEQCIINHVNKFPTEASHYSRTSNPHKLYLAPYLNMAKMYELYLGECRLENRDESYFIKKATYAKIFTTKFNLSFSHPKSDTCSKCDSRQSNEEHKENADMGYELMTRDRDYASNDLHTCYITVDLQQTMHLPKITTSKAFYLRQLWFYNLGIHVVTKDGNKSVMQTWTEDIAGRGSSEVASCLYHFAQTCPEVQNKDRLVVWSDSCSGQNKNFSLICLHQFMILKGLFKTIDHKFPEVGHTYLDSDRDFERIEKVLRKHGTILTPERYRNLLSASTKKSTVNDMEHYFRDIGSLPQKLGIINRKKDLLGDKVRFRDGIKWIRVEEFGSYLYKENYDEYTPFRKVSLMSENGTEATESDLESKQLTRHSTRQTRKAKEKNESKGAKTSEEEETGNLVNFELEVLQQKTGIISQEKLKNLREQLPYINEEDRWFYENILTTDPAPAKKKRKHAN